MAAATRVLAEGIYFGEGPRWHDGRLWFSDFYAAAVKSVSAAGICAPSSKSTTGRPDSAGCRTVRCWSYR